MNIKHLIPLALAAAVCACSGGSSQTDADAVDSLHHVFPDTLRVATLYSPSSYFIYRDQPMGYDYSLVSSLAEDKGAYLDLKVATSLSSAIDMLDSGLVDLIAYEVPVTAEYQAQVVACGPSNVTTQVLVQPRPRGKGSLITDVTQLVGTDVYVERDSKYEARLQNLNSELGGGIRIHTVNRDTLIAEDLIEMVSQGDIPLTVVDSDVARVNKTYYPDLDVSLELSFAQRASWGVRKGSEWLADSIDAWLTTDQPRKNNAALLKRYFEMSKGIPSAFNYDFSHGKISQYDDLMRKYSKAINYDWRMLAAQCFIESRFDNNVVSWAGARGIMQIMPSSARAYGEPVSALDDPEASIRLSCKIVESLDKSLKTKVSDAKERRKFVLAAYNSGIAHIYDAIALAEKYGKNPCVWDGNVADALLWKSNPEYYNDPVCKYGYFRGRQTTEYVRRVMEFYDRACKKVKN